jgi:hypothetical protein
LTRDFAEVLGERKCGGGLGLKPRLRSEDAHPSEQLRSPGTPRCGDPARTRPGAKAPSLCMSFFVGLKPHAPSEEQRQRQERRNPTHRDEAAMNGAPRWFYGWATRRANALAGDPEMLGTRQEQGPGLKPHAPSGKQKQKQLQKQIPFGNDNPKATHSSR